MPGGPGPGQGGPCMVWSPATSLESSKDVTYPGNTHKTCTAIHEHLSKITLQCSEMSKTA